MFIFVIAVLIVIVAVFVVAVAVVVIVVVAVLQNLCILHVTSTTVTGQEMKHLYYPPRSGNLLERAGFPLRLDLLRLDLLQMG